MNQNAKIFLLLIIEMSVHFTLLSISILLVEHSQDDHGGYFLSRVFSQNCTPDLINQMKDFFIFSQTTSNSISAAVENSNNIVAPVCKF